MIIIRGPSLGTFTINTYLELGFILFLSNPIIIAIPALLSLCLIFNLLLALEEKLKIFLERGKDWERKKITIDGVFILKIPPKNEFNKEKRINIKKFRRFKRI